MEVPGGRSSHCFKDPDPPTGYCEKEMGEGVGVGIPSYLAKHTPAPDTECHKMAKYYNFKLQALVLFCFMSCLTWCLHSIP